MPREFAGVAYFITCNSNQSDANAHNGIVACKSYLENNIQRYIQVYDPAIKEQIGQATSRQIKQIRIQSNPEVGSKFNKWHMHALVKVIYKSVWKIQLDIKGLKEKLTEIYNQYVDNEVESLYVHVDFWYDRSLATEIYMTKDGIDNTFVINYNE